MKSCKVRGIVLGLVGLALLAGTAVRANSQTADAASGELSLIQANSRFIDYSGVNESYAAFQSPVASGHLLVAIVAIAGGNPYTVNHVEDDLGNSWHKAVSGVNGDETDVEIWYANSTSAGADEVDAYFQRGAGGDSVFAQSYVTIAEFNGTGAFHAGTGKASSGTGDHGSGSFAASAGDLIVGGYADAGYVGVLSLADAGARLGAAFDGIDAIQAIDSYRTATSTALSSVNYHNTASAYAEVAGSSFTPTGSPTPPPPVSIQAVPCTVTINGVVEVGHCSGTFQP